MSYGEVLSRAWKIIWKYKVLWIFGILAGFTSGGPNGPPGGGDGNGTSNGNYGFPTDFWNQVGLWFEQNWWVIILLVGLAMLFMVAAVILGTFGRIGLVRGAWRGDEDVERLTFAQVWSDSTPYFWRVLLFAVLMFFIGVAGIIFLGIMFTAGLVLTMGIGLFCLIPLMCLLIPVFYLVGVLVEQIIVAMVGEDLGIGAAVTRAWDVFRAHLGEYILMGLILGIGGGIVRFFIILPFFLALVPVAVSLFTESQSTLTAGAITSLVLVCLYAPVALVLNGMVTSYIGAAWTVTFRRLTGRKPGGLPAVVEPAAVEPAPGV